MSINSKTTFTNETTNARENLNLNDDDLYFYRKEQEVYYSDYFNIGLELNEDMENFLYGNESTIFEIKQDPDHKNSENSFPNFNDINNFPPFNSIPNECENIKGKHTKYATDNIEKRIKVFFYDSILYCSNEQIKIYNQSQNGDGVYPLLKDIDSKIKKQSSKTENLKLLDNTVRDMLYQTISSKFEKFPPDYNIKLIDKIYREGKAKEVISFLNMKVLSLYNRFIEDDKANGKFNPLTYHIERLKKKEKKLDNDYLEAIVSTAKNFEANTREKKSRKRKKKIS